ncbi:MAG: RNA-binding protein [Candidatus Aminicenantes bacterium]|nr:RNA-binding protein [Candidatus Aminicenantes bacterium]
MSEQIYVGNLSYSMTEGSLRELFEQYGEVVSVKIIQDRMSGRSKGFGFVEMANKEEAETAIQRINGTEVDGRNIKVNFAKPRE